MFTTFYKQSILLYFVLITFMFSACEVTSEITTDQLPEPKATIYTIKKGQQHAVLQYKKATGSVMRFKATFDKSAVYQTIDPVNQADINKLYGVSDCGNDHHTNSARFGWRWFNNRLEIHAYTYINKVRKSEFIGCVDLNKPSTYELRMGEGKYTFILDGKEVILPRGCNSDVERYQLFPYFGGDEFAPHDITIELMELK
ncbi:hypothetical protein [Pontibacter arcticus]|uniref:Uncharacterized protein n=1 Tax=Pontibacter arcticus TaxID=2080288 RepID=A0A364RFZ4_9BACT|nr:hypothetical protein [Pontibacter arcticus]RAU83268.1 hypothetical protein DP923_08645 [Pontibacter arcticus]